MFTTIPGMNDYVSRIQQARVYDVAVETPLDPAPLLSHRLKNSIFLKREDLQPVFSFKLRGAYNKMASLPADVLKRGVVAASAGNHAQGVALSAQKLGCRARIVMPVTTPRIKVDAVSSRGAEVVLHGDSYDEAYKYARQLCDEKGLIFIHPYDDADVIAGQGTIGMEILKQHPGKLDVIFIAVGGGGLIGGVAAYVKSLRPEVRVVGVEPVDSDAMTRSIKEGHRVRLEQVGLFADGVAVKQVGEEPFHLAQTFVDEMILVSNDAICAAIKDVFEDTRSILEPAGALAVAGMKAWVEKEKVTGQTFVAIACGANMNFDRLRFVAERAEVGEAREALFAVTIPEKPGSFKEFCRQLGTLNVTEFNYRYSDPKEAHVFVGVQIANRADAVALADRLKTAELPALDLTDDEMAKLHIRYLVGGRAPQAMHERLYRFEFPERPGALMRFLDTMSSSWNISLFHYRNHGSDVGRVLVGMQVPASDHAAFESFLKQLSYPYADETDNPAYRLFL